MLTVRSASQFGQFLKKIQSFRVCQSLLVLHWSAMHDFANSEFSDLAGFCARYVGYCQDFCRHVTGARANADFALDALCRSLPAALDCDRIADCSGCDDRSQRLTRPASLESGKTALRSLRSLWLVSFWNCHKKRREHKVLPKLFD